MITIETHKTTLFGGKIVMTRQFFNPDTGEYLCIEAHEDEKGKFHRLEHAYDKRNKTPLISESMEPMGRESA